MFLFNQYIMSDRRDLLKKNVCSLQDSNRLTLMLEDTENWLYEDGEDQPKHVYEEKLDALKVCPQIMQTFFN